MTKMGGTSEEDQRELAKPLNQVRSQQVFVASRPLESLDNP